MAIYLSIVALLVVVLALRGKAIMAYFDFRATLSSATQQGYYAGKYYGEMMNRGRSSSHDALDICHKNNYREQEHRDAYDAAFKKGTTAGSVKARNETENRESFASTFIK